MKLSKMATLIAAVLWGVASGASALTSTPTDTVQGRAPTLTSAAVTYADTTNDGVVNAGDKLTAAGAGWSDDDGDDEKDSAYQWYRDSLPITNATASTYTLTADDMGTDITVGVVPQTDSNITDPYQGTETVASTGGTNGNGVVEVADVKDVAKVEVVNDASGSVETGHPIVDTTLRAKVTTAAGTTGSSADYTYQWMIEDAANLGTYIDILGATNETYTPVKGDQKLKLQVDVTKKP
ncbi:ZirU family protein [Aeromonas sp. Y318-1]|uniref:ZirU family protein n=1 Tax=Aeromonas TaxID=642 RepID=UPI0022E1995C|nr:ZirU family protein [Aeromonas sp. Y318-1]